MISVPEAATFPITPRPVASLKRSSSSCGKPSGKVGNGRSVTMPIISQCPVVVSIPRPRSASRPHTAGASARGGHPASGSTLPSPSCCSAGSSRPPTASATCPSVFDPAVPNRSASGRSPTPTASSTITQARAIPGNLDEGWSPGCERPPHLPLPVALCLGRQRAQQRSRLPPLLRYQRRNADPCGREQRDGAGRQPLTPALGVDRQRVQPEVVAAPLAEQHGTSVQVLCRDVRQRLRLQLPGRVAPAPSRQPVDRGFGLTLRQPSREAGAKAAAGARQPVAEQPAALLEAAAPVQADGRVVAVQHLQRDRPRARRGQRLERLLQHQPAQP